MTSLKAFVPEHIKKSHLSDQTDSPSQFLNECSPFVAFLHISEQSWKGREGIRFCKTSGGSRIFLTGVARLTQHLSEGCCNTNVSVCKQVFLHLTYLVRLCPHPMLAGSIGSSLTSIYTVPYVQSKSSIIHSLSFLMTKSQFVHAHWIVFVIFTDCPRTG